MRAAAMQSGGVAIPPLLASAFNMVAQQNRLELAGVREDDPAPQGEKSIIRPRHIKLMDLTAAGARWANWWRQGACFAFKSRVR